MSDSPTPHLPIVRPSALPLTAEAEATQRRAVVAEALSWRGTPYRQMGATKGPNGAVDCSMLLVRCWVDAGVFEEFDPRPYPASWYLHRSEERYLAWMETVAAEIESPQPGDIVLWRFGRCFSHSGLMVSETQFVHAFSVVRECQRGELTDPIVAWADSTGLVPRPRKFFSVWRRIRLSLGEDV